MKYVLILTLLMIVLVACPDDRYAYFMLQNKSEKTVVAAVGYIYPPDAGVPPKEELHVFRVLKPGQRKSISGYGFDDEGLRRMKKEKLTLFFIDKSIYDLEPWEKIQEDYLILKRIEATWDDYIEMGGEFTYP